MINVRLQVRCWTSDHSDKILAELALLLPTLSRVERSGTNMRYVTVVYQAVDEGQAVQMARGVDARIPYSHAKIDLVKIQETRGGHWRTVLINAPTNRNHRPIYVESEVDHDNWSQHQATLDLERHDA